MKTATRPRYPTKAAWAAAKADELRQIANEQAREYVPAGGRAVRRKMEGLELLRRDAARFDRMSARYAARGI